ncbi:uncharacterized protein LOC121909344 isoform X1 [Thunnus maccoyii]|uniref:uncharacterized protein LOC121909344 isoform X1 n=1 Tax=Thunnus maccoyii TaxID=8240 RepID=UPI001C4D28CA|nr:uncharacterized protein LOC121909344 isoform X1 [Thunnus maccoyii]
MPRKCKHKKTYLKWERAVVRLTVQIDSTRNRSYLSTGCRKLRRREANALLQFAETTGIQAPKHGLVVPILCQERRAMIPYTLTTCQVYSVSPPPLIEIRLSTNWQGINECAAFSVQCLLLKHQRRRQQWHWQQTKSLCGPGVNKEFDYLVPKKGHISLKCHAQFPSHDHLLAFWTLIEPATSRMVRTTRVSEAPADEGEEESFSRSTKLVPIDEFFLFLNYLSTGWSQRELGQCFNIYQTTVSAQLSSDNCSSQKSLCTFKAMVGMAPHGAVTFVSALYESLVSDKEISRQSGIIPLLSPDMAVMVDQRFLVDDLGSCKV